MDELNIVRLKTTKDEEVLVNFGNVSYGTETINKNTSLRFRHGHGKDCSGIYLVVKENIEEISKKLMKIPIQKIE